MRRRANESSSIGYGLEELKFLRSPSDVRRLASKVLYKFSTRVAVSPRGAAPKVPPSVQIEPTNLCNLRCTTCPGSRSASPRGYMDMDLFEKIATEAAKIGVKRIHLYLRGEPMIHPKIVEMVASIKAKRMAVHFATNGTKLTPEIRAGLLAAGMDNSDQLTISFLGHSKAGHEATMVGIDHDLVVSNVLEMMKLRSDLRLSGPVIEVILNAPPENLHESDDFLRFWKGKVDHARLGYISLEFQNYKQVGAAEITRDRVCNGIFERMPIFWNGQVPQCNGDVDGDWILGDAHTDSLVDLWNSERLQEVRRIHKEGRFEMHPECLHCDM